jgi:hypothetical protein
MEASDACSGVFGQVRPLWCTMHPAESGSHHHLIIWTPPTEKCVPPPPPLPLPLFHLD